MCLGRPYKEHGLAWGEISTYSKESLDRGVISYNGKENKKLSHVDASKVILLSQVIFQGAY